MNISYILNNDNSTFSTTTIRSIRKSYVENPFNSWYIGGILFLCTFMLGLLYANFYRKDFCHHCWKSLLPHLHIAQSIPSSSPIESSVNRIVEPVLV